jgi:hypothetical protein
MKRKMSIPPVRGRQVAVDMGGAWVTVASADLLTWCEDV